MTCAFCGEPATNKNVEISPPQMQSSTIVGRDGLPMPGQMLRRAAVLRDLCDHHYAIVERDRGWQERQRKEREKRAEELKRVRGQAQLDLFGSSEAA
jgi:hypothetical protein